MFLLSGIDSTPILIADKDVLASLIVGGNCSTVTVSSFGNLHPEIKTKKSESIMYDKIFFISKKNRGFILG